LFEALDCSKKRVFVSGTELFVRGALLLSFEIYGLAYSLSRLKDCQSPRDALEFKGLADKSLCCFRQRKNLILMATR